MKLSEAMKIPSELKNVKGASAQILESLLPFNYLLMIYWIYDFV